MKHKKIFIDCGFHHGEGLRHFINTLKIGPDWLVMAFEPNPECHMQERLLKILHEFPDLKTIDGYPMAVWIRNGTIAFRQENVFESESGSPVDGRSMRDGWLSQLQEIGADIHGLEAPIEVKCVNFSALIQAMAIHSKEIYVKMDIEGAEFKVLRELLSDNTARFIKKMWVEFHERFVPGESHTTKRELIYKLSLQTQIIEWH